MGFSATRITLLQVLKGGQASTLWSMSWIYAILERKRSCEICAVGFHAVTLGISTEYFESSLAWITKIVDSTLLKEVDVYLTSFYCYVTFANLDISCMMTSRELTMSRRESSQNIVDPSNHCFINVLKVPWIILVVRTGLFYMMQHCIIASPEEIELHNFPGGSSTWELLPKIIFMFLHPAVG